MECGIERINCLINCRVVCLSPADNSHGSLLGRLKGAHQPVIKPRNRFSVLVHPSLPACRQTDSAPLHDHLPGERVTALELAATAAPGRGALL